MWPIVITVELSTGCVVIENQYNIAAILYCVVIENQYNIAAILYCVVIENQYNIAAILFCVVIENQYNIAAILYLQSTKSKVINKLKHRLRRVKMNVLVKRRY